MAVASDPNNPRRELVIRPGHHDSEYLPDLWRYRELFYFLAWRDILVRYKQTTIGAAWAIIRPLLATSIVWARPLGHRLTHQTITRRHVAGATIIVVGLAAWAILRV